MRAGGNIVNYNFESSDRKYLLLKEKILKIVMLVGMAATLVGALYNTFNGYPGMPVYVHVAGFVLLLLLTVFYQKMKKTAVAVIAFAYFCFVYTPFAWFTLGGLYSSMAYVVYVFFLLISILLDQKAGAVFTWVYLAEIVLLVVENGFNHPENPMEPFFPKAFSYLVMLVILIVVIRVYQKQFTSFLSSSHRDSVTDVLTGLHNHRYLTETLAELEEAYHADNHQDYAVAVIDLDGFKQINDVYGHSTGDDVLNELGVIFGEMFEGQIVGRYGGDEFVAVFQGVPFQTCVQTCEQLMYRVRCHKFTDQKIDIRLSIGLCSRYKIEGGDLFSEADQLLYQAKQSRDKLCFRG